jgi:RimJ/RimL family protein N-acetyltransferase
MLSIRPLEHNDIPLILNYWFTAEHAFLKGMGVDIAKMPGRNEFEDILNQQLDLPVEQRRSYCVLWEIDGVAVGHSNTNPTTYRVEGTMHLHLWNSSTRKNGMGTAFVKLSLAHFFDKLQLQTIWCEPYALNPAPNKTLEKVGFELVKEYVTIPGSINFEQPVKQWKMTLDKFECLSINHEPR